MWFETKEYNYEVISTLLFIGFSPIIVIHVFCLIGITFYTKTFQYPLKILYVLLIWLGLFVVGCILLCAFSKKIKIVSNNGCISFNSEVIKKKNIKKIEYVKFNMLLLPFLYFINKGNGLIMEISYIGENYENKVFSLRVSNVVFNRIKQIIDL